MSTPNAIASDRPVKLSGACDGDSGPSEKSPSPITCAITISAMSTRNPSATSASTRSIRIDRRMPIHDNASTIPAAISDHNHHAMSIPKTSENATSVKMPKPTSSSGTNST
jgi:hypothetical protein